MMEHSILPEFLNCTYTGNNCIVPEYTQNRHIVELLIDNACYALNSVRNKDIFKPIPASWIKNNINAENAKDSLSLITDSKVILDYICFAKHDEDLITKIGENTYGFIKFVISTNKAINIEPCNLINKASINNKIIQNKFNYTKDIEDNFSKQKTIYLYHGSPYENWYSIMRTGIKIASKDSKLFLNGAAYGNGIYLSNDINVSLGYSNRCLYHNERTNSEPKYMLAIYEVIDNPKWKKTENIFVIDDENALILRFIIVLHNNTLPKEVSDNINFKLNSGAQKQKDMEKEKATEAALSKAYSKRLMMEYKKLIKQSPDILGFTIKLATEDNLRVWQLCINKIDNPKLEVQMQKYNIPYIEMEFTFPEAYPIEPPFIRIVYPRFKSLTGHITQGGSICMEAVSKSGWIPTTNVEALIIQIKLILSEGDAVIDETNFNKRYDIETARTAFARAMATHNW